VLAARLGSPLPENAVVDAGGNATRDAAAGLLGGILPFAGHKGFGLSLLVQAFGVMAGAMAPAAHVKGFGFVFIVFAPDLLMPVEQFRRELRDLVARVKATATGTKVVRIPSERAFADRARRRVTGVTIPRTIYDRIAAL
jgi:LDH2 family malate/lactate/ureidoglycolate dehydrogenase